MFMVVQITVPKGDFTLLVTSGYGDDQDKTS